MNFFFGEDSDITWTSIKLSVPIVRQSNELELVAAYGKSVMVWWIDAYTWISLSMVVTWLGRRLKSLTVVKLRILPRIGRQGIKSFIVDSGTISKILWIYIYMPIKYHN